MRYALETMLELTVAAVVVAAIYTLAIAIGG